MKTFLLVMVVVLSACSATKITSTWKSPAADTIQFKRIMVVGLIRESDRSLQEKMEKHLVDDLNSMGYQAVSAFQYFGPNELKDLSEQEIYQKLGKENIDAVMTVVLLDKEKERHYVPGHIMYSPYAYYSNRFFRYYHVIYGRIEYPGYYTQSTKYFWESNLYDLNHQMLLCSVQTQSFDPASTNELAHNYGLKIVDEMEKQRVLIPKTKW